VNNVNNVLRVASAADEEDTVGEGMARRAGSNRQNVYKCYSAVAALFVVFLLPGCAVTNQWKVPAALLWSYVGVGVAVCGWLVCRVDFHARGDKSGNKSGERVDESVGVSEGKSGDGESDGESGDGESEGESGRGVLKKIFLCPAVPWVPAIGLASNSYLMTQRPWQGWVRLLAITLLVFVGYVARILWKGTRVEERRGGSGHDSPSRVPLLHAHDRPSVQN
jgi:hypothetical protein